ncbi:hypothetical protein D6C77_08531 [Aureobasidium pullulans]|nr:hypothetical protein D6C77_08531 [Aureobasidium pullulans]
MGFIVGGTTNLHKFELSPSSILDRQPHHKDAEDLLKWGISTLIAYVKEHQQVDGRFNQVTKTPGYQELETLLYSSATLDANLQSWCEALEAMLDQSPIAFKQTMFDSRVDPSALLHYSIQRGHAPLVNHIFRAVSQAQTSYGGTPAMQAAWLHATRAITASALIFPKPDVPPIQVWQTLKERLEICCLFKETNSGSLWIPGVYDNMFQRILPQAPATRDRYTICLYAWEIPEFIKSWEQAPSISSGNIMATARSRFFNTITISGRNTFFEATTCEQYLTKRWGELGTRVANWILDAALLVRMAKDGAPGTQSTGHLVAPVTRLDDINGLIDVDAPAKTALAYAFPNHLCLLSQNAAQSEAIAMKDIAEWLCKTFRPIADGHTMGLQESRTVELVDFQGDVFEHVAFALSPLSPLNIERDNCWIPLFERGIVAETEVSRDRQDPAGIEMSFELMTTLAAVETYHYIHHQGDAGGLILLGFFTALVPILLHESGVFQWHFEYTEVDVLQANDLESTQHPWAFVEKPADLARRRCIVGMWPQANIMLGVEGTKLDLEDSGLAHLSKVSRPSGFELTAAVGITGGPVQGIVQATRTYVNQATIQRFIRPNLYVRALDRLSQAVALVYDCKSHIGWLVPQTSLLLHLCHAYNARLSSGKGLADPIPWAKASTDGAAAAGAALRGAGDIVVSRVGDHADDKLLLRQLLVDLNSNLQATQATRQRPKKMFRWTKEVYFAELQDQFLEPDNGSALRVLNPSEWPSIEAWLEITSKVDGLLVCKNLDQAIALVGSSCSPNNQSQQASNNNNNIINNNNTTTATTTATTTQAQLSTHLATCSSCARVPEGRGYLVAHAWCLQNVLKRPSPIAGRDMATWIQNGKPFDVHLHAPNESIWTHPEKVLQSFAKSERGSVCNKTGGHTVEGAVVFGKYGEESLGEWLRKVALSP